MDAYPAVPIAATALLTAGFGWLAVELWRTGRSIKADNKRQAELREAARQDPSADDHRFTAAALVGDTDMWIRRHGGTWEPLNPYSPDLCLRIQQPGCGELTARPGDTLHWDGERITVQQPTATSV